jgi:hypothetical protein
MKIVGIASSSLVLLAIACGSESPSPSSDRPEPRAGVVDQSLTRTVLLSANFQNGLAPFTNTDGRCVTTTFTGSTGIGVVCFNNTALSVEVDARRFSDLQFRYTRGTSAYEANDALLPLAGTFLNGAGGDTIIGSSPVAPGGFDIGRALENTQFTLNFLALTQTDGSPDFDAFFLDEFVVTGTPVPDDTCDGLDQDGDGVNDEDYVGPVTQCGVGACANSAPMVCVDGKPVCVQKPPAPDDSTCDRIDDDCDNRIDEDSACGSPYRTVIVMGDTQSLSYLETRRPLREQVNWIRDNLNKDNIDFVLQVGDLIEQGQIAKGQFIDGCRVRSECATIPDVGPHSACRVPGGTAPLSSPPCGCFTAAGGAAESPPARPTGYSCGQIVRDVDAEWAQIQSELFRLNDHLPYMVVRGNHDNPSVADLFGGPFPAIQPRGLRDYFGPSFYQAQQARYSTGARRFKVLNIGAKFLGYAFQFKLGGHEDITVVGMDDFNSGITYARDFLTANPNLPTILLRHQGLYRPPASGQVDQANQAWTSLLEPRLNEPGPFARQVFMAVQGHIVQNTQEIVDIGNVGHVLRVQRDNQVEAPTLPKAPTLTLPDATYLTAVRFYLDTNEVEVVTVSARENKVLTGPGFSLSRSALSIPRFTN